MGASFILFFSISEGVFYKEDWDIFVQIIFFTYSLTGLLEIIQFKYECFDLNIKEFIW